MKKLALILLVIAAACRKDHDPPIQLAAGEIVFMTKQTLSDKPQFAIMQQDGSNRRNLTEKADIYGPFAVSHNGQYIAYTLFANNAYHLYVVNKAGGNPVLLDSGSAICGWPEWSPNDQKLVYIKSNDRSEVNVFISDRDGQQQQQLTTGNRCFYPKWFPNGDILFINGAATSDRGFYTMQADGSRKQKIASNQYMLAEPIISPAGDKIALVVSGFEQGGKIYVMNADGSNLKHITDRPSHFPVEDMIGESNTSPAWSPDGKRIAYVSVGGGRSEIYIMNSDGSNDKRLTNNGKWNANPSWSKDGQYLLFVSGRNGDNTSEIFVMRTTGKSQTALTQNAGYNTNPVFIAP